MRTKGMLTASLLITLFAAAGCGGQVDGPAPGNEEGAFSSLEQYYASFYYQEINEDWLRSRYLSAADESWERQLGPRTYFDLDLLLLSGGRYIAYYTELEPHWDGGMAHVAERELEGAFYLNGSTLVLEGLGSLTPRYPADLHPGWGVSLRFNRDLVTPGLRDRTTTLRMVRSSWRL